MVSPTLPAQRTGNGITAARWAKLLRELGHRVRIVLDYAGEDCDLLVVLHAKKSAAAGHAFKDIHPERPLVVALTGTDLYLDLRNSARAHRLLARASALVTLQPLAMQQLPSRWHSKVHVILQSAMAPAHVLKASRRTFDVAVLAHARRIKDPLRAAMAARKLPAESRLRVLHAGRSMSAEFDRRIKREMDRNPRYKWLGELSHAKALRLLARSQALVVSSIVEGGANVVSEAAVLGVPILASRIPGSLGLLGQDYNGFFEARDTEALTALFRRLESEPAFGKGLRRQIRRLARRLHPDRERQAWNKLVRGLVSTARGNGR